MEEVFEIIPHKHGSEIEGEEIDGHLLFFLKKNETPPLPLANRFEETFKALATELQDIQSFAQKHPDKVEPESAPIALSELTHVTGTPLLKPLK